MGGASYAYLFPLPDPSAPGGSTVSLIRSGANAQLKPETAREWNVGFDLTPPSVNSLKISGTYFQIDYTNRIINPLTTLSGILSNPFYAPIITRNPSAALQAVIASVQSFSNYTSAPYDPAIVVAYVAGGLQNIGVQDVNGFDLSGSYSRETSLGRFTGVLDASWLNITEQLIAGEASSQVTGIIFSPPGFRLRAGLTWERDGWTAGAFVNNVSSETDNTDALRESRRLDHGRCVCRICVQIIGRIAR